ncbi:MAG: hypothetical protein HKP62_01155, partial [Sulfurovum sp.]|nr:hypothetical protein [Sulfurovum sp.]NNJ44602.1 hypothetical protein [Sulfurovum sp.]
TTEVTSDTFVVAINDDIPVVTGNVSLTTENDGSYNSGVQVLTQAVASNDVTSVEWDLSNIGAVVEILDEDGVVTGTEVKALTFDGYEVTYVDNGDGTLTGSANGIEILKVTIDTDTLNDAMNPTYQFELLSTVGRLGYIDTSGGGTVISGGNVTTLELGFGTYLIDSFTAVTDVGTVDEAVATVNSSGYIGVAGNWFDDGDELYMSFSDTSGEVGQVGGIDLVVQGSGNSAYEVHWSVTAVSSSDGSTLISYSGVFYGKGNKDTPFTIPLENEALYFTDVTLTAPDMTYVTDLEGNLLDKNGDIVGVANTEDTSAEALADTLPNNHNNAFRIEVAGITGNNYTDDIDLAFDYTLIDADGDRAEGTIDVHLDNLTAQVVDGIIEGLYYETSSGLSGYTDTVGYFDYLEDDVVTFKIGNVALGRIDTAAIEDGKVFLQDIADVERTDMNDEYVENMAVLLQSIDSDSGDNIVISEAMHAAFLDDSFDLATISEEELIAIIEANGATAVSEEDAMAHVGEMLEAYDGVEEGTLDVHIDDTPDEGIYILGEEHDIDFSLFAVEGETYVPAELTVNQDPTLTKLTLLDVLDITHCERILTVETDEDADIWAQMDQINRYENSDGVMVAVNGTGISTMDTIKQEKEGALESSTIKEGQEVCNDFTANDPTVVVTVEEDIVTVV